MRRYGRITTMKNIVRNRPSPPMANNGTLSLYFSTFAWPLLNLDQATEGAFAVLASALVAPVIRENPFPSTPSILVVPGGRVSLITYKATLQPALSESLKAFKISRFRLWRALADVKILTREAFEERLSSDPVEGAQGQMMMF